LVRGRLKSRRELERKRVTSDSRMSFTSKINENNIIKNQYTIK